MCTFRTVAAKIALILVFISYPASAAAPENDLRLPNTSIFGTSVDEGVVLLDPKSKLAVSPETILVDIDQSMFYAATLSYPKLLSLADAKRCINRRYGKWESKKFADDPEMGIWRNEDEKVSLQLTEDDDHIVLIYIKFSLVRDEILARGWERATRDVGLDRKSHGAPATEANESHRE